MGNFFSTRKDLIVLRGLPGSGKSTYAREVVREVGAGVILSSDDYFLDAAGNYVFDSKKLKDSHIWNQTRAASAMRAGQRLVIIDNTNVRKWEAKPYVKVAVEYGYNVAFREPPLSWVYSLDELMKRDDKKVPRKTMERMQKDWESDFSVQSVLASQAPWEKYSKKNRSLTSINDEVNRAHLHLVEEEENE